MALGVSITVLALCGFAMLILYVRKTTRLISKQKEEIEKLNAVFEKMSIIGKAAANSVIIMDSEANIQWANIGFGKIFGYTIEEYIEKYGKNPLKASPNTELGMSLKQVFDTKQPASYESRKETKSGEKIWMQTTLTPFLDSGGNISNIVSIDTNIVELKIAQDIIKEKNKEITDSIKYASRLQTAILPPIEFIKEHLPDIFILYKPKDIVAGDFYWAEYIDDTFFIAAADCTGHGVPGALVSVVCSNALNRATKEFKLKEPGKILDKVTDIVLETFEKHGDEIKDGMDISLLAYKPQSKRLFWSGANNPLWYIQNGAVNAIKADKQPVGKFDVRAPFKTNSLEYVENTMFYLISDGFADQFGGPSGKKYKYKQLQDRMIEISTLPLHEQKVQLEKSLNEWKGDLEQVDDITIIGIKI